MRAFYFRVDGKHFEMLFESENFVFKFVRRADGPFYISLTGVPKLFILTFPYSPPLPISTPMSLMSSQIGTNFSGGNGVFDSYVTNQEIVPVRGQDQPNPAL